MSKLCLSIHTLANQLKRHAFPFYDPTIPLNGVYFLFQKGEMGHQQDRIVRIGTHTGINQLRLRLKQHFVVQNKDRSIFRKNIGRALLKQSNDPFIEQWEPDLTAKKAREKYEPLIDFDYMKIIENRVSEYIQDNFSFAVFEVDSKIDRLKIEAKLISTVSLCNDCQPSSKWLGNHSPKEKIVNSGLWQVNELYKTPFDAIDAENFKLWFKD